MKEIEQVTLELTEEEVQEILKEYRIQQLREHMVGPIVSFMTHLIGLVLLCIYAVTVPQKQTPEIEVSIEPMEIKEIQEKVIDEIDQINEDVDEVAPEMTNVEVPTSEVTNDTSIEDVSDEAPTTDDDMDMEEVLDVVADASPLKVPGLYGGRTAAGRASASQKYGASKGGQSSVLKALRWLARVQEQNGSWANNPAHSGLAMLCFLAHGETPLSEEFGVTVQKGMQWMASNMPSDRLWGNAYAHGIVTYALAEAYGMTQIPFLRSAMENGLSTLINGQQAGGGFDYNYAKGARWDMSVSGWQMQAMKAAWVAGSSNTDLERAMDKAIRFCKSAYRSGTFGYSSPGGAQNLTGTGTLCLQLLGEKKAKEAMGGGQWVFENRLKTYENAKKDWKIADGVLYGWYYDTQAVFQRQGKEWKQWNDVFQNVLTKNQTSEGYWETGGHIGGENLAGRILTTTFCCLQLEVYYRYLPTFQISKDSIIKTTSTKEDDGTNIIIE